jgi:predicted transcriptional regulator
MSPRAAWRLEQLGFSAVYDYTAGKVDWLAAGQPTEGPGPSAPRVNSAMDKGVPTCLLDDEAGPAAARAKTAGWPVCVVANDTGIVAGRLRVDKVAPDNQLRAEEVMEAGPATIRANDDLAGTMARMADRHVAVLLVSTPEGKLLGAVRSSG